MDENKKGKNVFCKNVRCAIVKKSIFIKQQKNLVNYQVVYELKHN